MVRPEEAEELARQARESSARLREQVADAHQRVGERQHAAEELMHHVADKLPDPEPVHRRAQQLSDRGDELLRKAERERAVLDAGDGG